MTLRASTAVLVQSSRRDALSQYGRWHTPEAVVCWASVTKVFVAGLARSLVAEGRLSWDLPVGTLIGTVAPEAMTVRALIEHTSGLPRALPEQKPTLPDPYAGWTTEQFDDRVLSHLTDLAGPSVPDSGGYSNVGYAVLARAIEISQGRPWLELVRERVVEPLGMPGSAVLLAPPEGSSSQPPQALGSRDIWGRPVRDWDVSDGPFSAAGGLCSTVPDMARILRAALDTESPLSPGDGPHAWQQHGARAWHNGALLRSGSLIVVDTDKRTVAAAHAVGGLPGHGARHAEKALGTLLARAAVRDDAPAGGAA